MLKSCLAVLVLLFLVAGTARAENCPAKSLQLDDIVVALKAASNCNRAMKTFEACEFSANGDVELGAVVEKKCEGDFLVRLTIPQKQAYQRQMRRCDRKYKTASGTMYASFTAFCRAQVAQQFSHQALRGAGSLPAR